MPCHGCLRARVSGMGWLGLCPARAGGFRDGAGQVGDKLLENMVVAFENRVWGTICTICHYLKLLGFNC